MTSSIEKTLTNELAQAIQGIISRLDQHDTSQISSPQRANHRAIKNWLTKYQSPQNVLNLDQVHGYREAFYHFCAIEDWEGAWGVASMKLDTPNAESLSEQLGIWGYRAESFEIYSHILNKLSPEVDSVCYGNIAAYHQSNSDYEQGP